MTDILHRIEQAKIECARHNVDWADEQYRVLVAAKAEIERMRKENELLTGRATAPITTCRTCNTPWDDCDVLSEGECADCLRREVERLRTAVAAVVKPSPFGSPVNAGQLLWKETGGKS